MIIKKNKITIFTDDHAISKHNLQYNSSAGYKLQEMKSLKSGGWRDKLVSEATNKYNHKITKLYNATGRCLEDV